jgi:hypothetical protein
MPVRTEENLSAPAPHGAPPEERRQDFDWHRTKAVWILLVFVAALLAIGGTLLALHWPFTQTALRLALEQDSQARVEMGSYRETYFLHPGGVAENVVIERDAHSPRLTIRRLTIVGSYLGLLGRYIPRVVAEGAVLSVPAGALNELFASPSPGQSPTDTRVGEIDADGAQIVVSTEGGDPPLTFDFHGLKLQGVSKDSAVRFIVSLQIPAPIGDAQLQGQIGPFRRDAAGSTPLSGSYSFKNAKLEQFIGIGGVLSSEGKFAGNLQAINVDGATDTPDFQLDVGVHPVPLTTKFHAVVNGTNGDLRLDPVEASFGKTTVIARGDIQGPSGAKDRKTTALDMTCSSGRVQDLLQLFVHDNQPPMSGAITFRTHVVLPPEIDHFLRKVKLDGEFGIEAAKFTNYETQQEVDILSADARGQADKIEDDQDKDKKNGNHAAVHRDLQPVVSNFKGKIILRNGIANFTNLSFDTPGATALLNGTYGLESRQIDMSGTAHLDTKLSAATTGVKSFLLKVIGPLKPNHGEKGSTVGVHVTGTYGHPSYAVQPMKGG